MRRLPAVAPILLLALAAPPTLGDSAADAGYAEEIEAWRERRVERLTAEEGWVTLVGLFWLTEGDNRLGGDPASDVPLPAGKAPAEVGTIRLADGELTLEADPAAGLTRDGEPVATLALASDASGEPTVLELGDLVLYVIERGGRYGVRVKDRRHPKRSGFPGIESFPIDPGWRVAARFVENDPPRAIPVPTVLGTVEEMPSWGSVEFEAGGATHRLEAIADPGDEELFLIFADATTGTETYGGGRYLYAGAPDGAGRVVLDFNKAYNPPCVFTAYATCPLPPRSNRLPIRIEAGEKITGLEDFTGY